MRHDVPTDRLQRIRTGEWSTFRVGDDLVGDDHGDAKLVGDARELAQKLAQVHLARAELSASFVFGTV